MRGARGKHLEAALAGEGFRDGERLGGRLESRLGEMGKRDLEAGSAFGLGVVRSTGFPQRLLEESLCLRRVSFIGTDASESAKGVCANGVVPELGRESGRTLITRSGGRPEAGPTATERSRGP